jgi:peptidoglycan/LPS O-acetylase OafA/YrhL
MKRIAGLDGLRALSILLVLCGHLDGTRGFPISGAFLNHLGDVANLGVRVFFVISGYLITLLLLKEEQKTGTISLKQFYLRRTSRIFPASYFFILCVAFAYYCGAINLHQGDLLHAFTYTMNYFPNRSWWVGHLWSLSVEEQFYLLWPATLLLLGVRKGLKVAIGVVLLSPFLRLGTEYFWVAQRTNIGNSFHTVADAIAIGCVLAGYEETLMRRQWFRSMLDSPWFFLVPTAIFTLNLRTGGRIRWFVLETMMNVLIAVCVCRVTICKGDFLERVLNWGPVAFLGTLSYSLYLWQQVFINRGSIAWWASFPQNVVLAFGAALLSYYAIEKPALKLRDAKRVRHLPSMAISEGA